MSTAFTDWVMQVQEETQALDIYDVLDDYEYPDEHGVEDEDYEEWIEEQCSSIYSESSPF